MRERWKVGKRERIERSKNPGGRDKRSTKWRESTIWIWKASVQPSSLLPLPAYSILLTSLPSEFAPAPFNFELIVHVCMKLIGEKVILLPVAYTRAAVACICMYARVPRGIRHLQCIGEGVGKRNFSLPQGISWSILAFQPALASFSHATARIDHFPLENIFSYFISAYSSVSLMFLV